MARATVMGAGGPYDLDEVTSALDAAADRHKTPSESASGYAIDPRAGARIADVAPWLTRWAGSRP